MLFVQEDAKLEHEERKAPAEATKGAGKEKPARVYWLTLIF